MANVEVYKFKSLVCVRGDGAHGPKWPRHLNKISMSRETMTATKTMTTMTTMKTPSIGREIPVVGAEGNHREVVAAIEGAGKEVSETVAHRHRIWHLLA